MSLFERIQHKLNEAPVGKDGSILPNPSDSNKDKKITKKFIKQYSKKETTNKQPELFDTSKVGKKDPVKDVKNVSDITGGKRAGIRGAKPILPGSTPKPKKPKVVQPTIGVNQSEVSKKAKEFTKDINKANVKRQETVAKRKYFRGRKAQRVPGASGVKPTGSFSKGTLKSSPAGQRAYDYEKMKIDYRDQLKKDKAFDRKISKGLKKPLPKGVTPTSIVRQDVKQFMSKVKSGDPKAKKELMDLVDKDFQKKTPAKQREYVQKIYKIQKAKGREFNPKTGNFEPSEFQKSLRKAGASGDVSPTAGPKIRKRVEAIRKTRAAKLGLDDPFDVDTSKAAKQSRKAFGTPTKSQIKKLSKKPGGYRAPKGDFGKGLTPGEFRGKQMDVKAFKKTTTKDILTDPKLSKQYGVKSFQKFSRDLQDFKDRDMPGGPRKTKTTKPKTSGATLTRQDVGMAPPDTPKRTPRVKQILRKKADEMGGSKYMKRMKPYLDTTKKQRDTLAKKPNRTPETTKQIRTYNRILKGKQLPDEVALAAIPKKSNTPPPLDPPPNNSSRKTFKQMQRDLRGKDGKVTYNFTDRPAAKLTRGFKGQLGKRAFVGKVAKGLAKRPGLTGALTIAGLYGANELRKAFFGPKAPKREKIKITPPKGYSKFSDIPQNKRTETDKQLMNVGRSSISPAALKQMGKGGRYDPGKGFNLKKYSQSDAYKDTLRQIRAKTGKKNLDPYGVMGNKK